MNEQTHYLIAKKALSLLDIGWTRNLSDSEIRYWVLVPDKIDKDNLKYGYWYHSRKMYKRNGKIIWKHGSVVLAASGLVWMIRNFLKEGNFQEAKRGILKLSHYLTDAMTVPHLVYDKLDDYHSQFEKDIEKVSEEIISELELEPARLKHKHSVYDSLVYECEQVFEEQGEAVLKLYKNGAEMNNGLKKSILKRCLQCNLDILNQTINGKKD